METDFYLRQLYSPSCLHTSWFQSQSHEPGRQPWLEANGTLTTLAEKKILQKLSQAAFFNHQKPHVAVKYIYLLLNLLLVFARHLESSAVDPYLATRNETKQKGRVVLVFLNGLQYFNLNHKLLVLTYFKFECKKKILESTVFLPLQSYSPLDVDLSRKIPIKYIDVCDSRV